MPERPDFGLERREAKCPRCGCGGGAEVRMPGMTAWAPIMCDGCQEAVEHDEFVKDEAHRIELALNRAGRNARNAEWSLETYPKDAAGLQAVRVARQWIGEYTGERPPLGHQGGRSPARPAERRNLILYGSVGSGKTGLAWSIVRDLIVFHRVDAMLVNWRELLAELRQSYADRKQGLHTDYVRVGRAPVLALDDVGAERPTDWAREELASVIEQRYARQLPTIITSNYAPSQLADRIGHDDIVIGQRIVSRLTDGATKHEMKTRDRRLG